MWDRALGLLGATAGLAAVLYASGFAISWIRYLETGYDPAIALEHQPQSNMVALGAQGALAIAVLVGVMLFARWLFLRASRRPYQRLLTWAARRKVDHDDDDQHRLEQERARLRAKLSGWVAGRGHWVCAALVAASLFTTWRLVALAVLVFACYEATRSFPTRASWGDLSVRRWVGLVGAAAAIIVLWQVTPVVHTTGALLSPPPLTTGQNTQNCKGSTAPQPLTGVAIPYFGQDGSYVYVDVIRCFWKESSGNYHYQLSYRISQLPLKDQGLALTSGVWLGGPRQKPVCSIWSKLKSTVTASSPEPPQAQTPGTRPAPATFLGIDC